MENLAFLSFLNMFTPMQLVLVAVVAVIAAVVGAVGGFGTGVLLTAVLTPILGIKLVVPVLGVAGIIINSGRFWFYRKDIDWKSVWLVLPPALLLLWVGIWMFSSVPAKPLTLLVGVLFVAFVPLRRWLKSRGFEFGKRGLVAGGGLFGLLTGFSTGAGVWLVSLLLGSGLVGRAVVATDSVITILADVARSVAFSKVQLLEFQSIMLGLAIGVLTIPGSALGSWLTNRMNAKLHTSIIEGLIVFGGINLIYSGLR